MRRFLSTPAGWMMAQVAGLALVLAVARVGLYLVPTMSAGTRATIIVGAAVVVSGGMYAFRRHYLTPPGPPRGP